MQRYSINIDIHGLAPKRELEDAVFALLGDPKLVDKMACLDIDDAWEICDSVDVKRIE